MKSNMKTAGSFLLAGILASAALLSGCGEDTADGKTVVEIVQYKPEAVKAFEALEEMQRMMILNW